MSRLPPPRPPLPPNREVVGPPQDESKYSKYEKMKAILPEGAVRHKMNLDGFTPEEIENFLNGTYQTQSTPPLPRATPPARAPPPPRPPADTTIIERSTPSPRPPPPRPPPKAPTPTIPPPASIASSPIETEGSRFAKYEKMKSILPEGAVRQKMNLEGFTPDEIEAFFGGTTTSSTNQPPPPRPPSAPSPRPPPTPPNARPPPPPSPSAVNPEIIPTNSNPSPAPPPTLSVPTKRESIKATAGSTARRSVVFSSEPPSREEYHVDNENTFQSVNNRVRVMSEGGGEDENEDEKNETSASKAPEDGDIKSFVTTPQSTTISAEVTPVKVPTVPARRLSMVPMKSDGHRKLSVVEGDHVPSGTSRRLSVTSTDNKPRPETTRRSSLLPDLGKLTSQLPPAEHHNRRSSVTQEPNRRTSVVSDGSRKLSIVEDTDRRLSMINMHPPIATPSRSKQQKRPSMVNLEDPSIRNSHYHARKSIFSGDDEVKLNTFDWKRNSAVFGGTPIDSVAGSKSQSPVPTSKPEETKIQPPIPPAVENTKRLSLFFGSVDHLEALGSGAASPHRSDPDSTTISPSPKFSSFSKLFPEVQALSPVQAEIARFSPTAITPPPMPTANPFYQKINEGEYVNKIKECLHELKEQLTTQLQQFANYTMQLEKASSDQHLKDCLQFVGHSSSSSSTLLDGNHQLPSEPLKVSPTTKQSPRKANDGNKTPTSSPTKTPTKSKSSPTAHSTPSASTNLTWSDVKQILRLNNMVLQYNSNVMKEDQRLQEGGNSATSAAPGGGNSAVTPNPQSAPTAGTINNPSGPGNTANEGNPIIPVIAASESEGSSIAMKKQYLLKKIELDLLKPKKLSQQRSFESAANSFEQYLQQYEQLLLHQITIYDNFLQEFINTSYDILEKEMKELDDLFYHHSYQSLHHLLEMNFNQQKNRLINIQQQLSKQGKEFQKHRMMKYEQQWSKNLLVMKEIQEQYNTPLPSSSSPSLTTTTTTKHHKSASMSSTQHHYHQVKQYYLNKIDQTISQTYENIYYKLEKDELFNQKQYYQDELFQYKRNIFQWKWKYQQMMEDRINYIEIIMNSYYLSYLEELYDEIHLLYEYNSKLYFYYEKLNYHLENLIYKHEQRKVTDEDMHNLKYYYMVTPSHGRKAQSQSNNGSNNQQSSVTQGTRKEGNSQHQALDQQGKGKDENHTEDIGSGRMMQKENRNILAIGTHIRSLAMMAGLSSEDTADIMDQLYAATTKGKGLGSDVPQTKKEEKAGLSNSAIPSATRNINTSKHQYHIKNLKKPPPPPPPPPARPASKDEDEVVNEESSILSNITQSVRPFSSKVNLLFENAPESTQTNHQGNKNNSRNNSRNNSLNANKDSELKPVSILKTSTASLEEKKTYQGATDSSVGKKVDLAIDSEAPRLTSPKGKNATFSPRLTNIFDDADVVLGDIDKEKEKVPIVSTEEEKPVKVAEKMNEKKNALAALLAKNFANR
eukprot:gene881-934_t